MYLFDPTLVEVVMAAVAMLAAAYLAAWAVTGGEGATAPEDQAGGEPGIAETEELEVRQKVILWIAAAAVLVFLLWWASLSAGSGGGPAL